MHLVPSLHIIYASTSGHTEYVVGVLEGVLKEKGMSSTAQRAELATADDFSRGDVLLLASSTWNTGGPEGQLNPHMLEFLTKHAAASDLAGRKVAVIGLGDERYRYTCRAAELLENFVKGHNGVQVGETLRIVNEPYGQEEKVKNWGKKLLSSLAS